MLKVENLHVSYGAIKAIKGVSFEVKEGEIVTLIGSNGAGKTTILKTISGILSATEGVVYFKNEPISIGIEKLKSQFKAIKSERKEKQLYLKENKINPLDQKNEHAIAFQNLTNQVMELKQQLKEAKVVNKTEAHELVELGVSHVPEGRRVFPKLTVYENLQMGAYTRDDKEEIASDLEEVYRRFPRLQERKDQVAGTLSGGEQQMLAMGRALMSKPKIMLMDEPSMGLAPILVDEIFSIIEDLNKQGTTILLVEQNANRALQISHKGYVLETGKIIAQGDSKDLLNDPKVIEAYLSA